MHEALRNLKQGRAKDETEIVAEILKDGSASLVLALVDLFNDILSSRLQPPAEWKRTKLVVIFKKGDPKLVSNYRPLASIPILYKLFARVLCSRLQKLQGIGRC